MYIRPDSVPRPTTWHKFQAPGLDGSPTTYEIRDLIDDDLEKAIDLMTKYYIRDEPQSKLLGLIDDPASVEDFHTGWRIAQSQRMPIACYEIKSGDLVGVNFLGVLSKDDPKCELKGSKWMVQLQTLVGKYDSFDYFGTDKYIIEYGLATLDAYRYRGIATELLKARRPLMKALGIKHSFTGFSAPGSFKAGQKAGYKVISEVWYEDLIRKGYPYEGIDTYSEKYISTTFCLETLDQDDE